MLLVRTRKSEAQVIVHICSDNQDGAEHKGDTDFLRSLRELLWVGKESHFQSHVTATPEPDPVLLAPWRGTDDPIAMAASQNWCFWYQMPWGAKGCIRIKTECPSRHLTTTVFRGEPNMSMFSVLCSFLNWERKSSSSEFWGYFEFYFWRIEDDNLGIQLSWVMSSQSPNGCPRTASMMAADQDIGKMAAHLFLAGDFCNIPKSLMLFKDLKWLAIILNI